MPETTNPRDSRNHRIGGDSMVDWTRDPFFEFTDEVDALTTVQELGDELVAARKQVEHTMRYLREAILRAHADGTKAEALIGHSGLARRTVYQMIAPV
jgi:predicted alpha/beta hydrolase